MVPIFLCLVLVSPVTPGTQATRAPLPLRSFGDAANAATRLHDHEPRKRSLQEGALSDPSAEEISTDPTQFAALLQATEGIYRDLGSALLASGASLFDSLDASASSASGASSRADLRKGFISVLQGLFPPAPAAGHGTGRRLLDSNRSHSVLRRALSSADVGSDLLKKAISLLRTAATTQPTDIDFPLAKPESSEEPRSASSSLTDSAPADTVAPEVRRLAARSLGSEAQVYWADIIREARKARLAMDFNLTAAPFWVREAVARHEQRKKKSAPRTQVVVRSLGETSLAELDVAPVPAVTAADVAGVEAPEALSLQLVAVEGPEALPGSVTPLGPGGAGGGGGAESDTVVLEEAEGPDAPTLIWPRDHHEALLNDTVVLSSGGLDLSYLFPGDGEGGQGAVLVFTMDEAEGIIKEAARVGALAMGPFLAPDLDLSFVTAAPPQVAWDSSEIQALDSRDSASWPYDISLAAEAQTAEGPTGDTAVLFPEDASLLEETQGPSLAFLDDIFLVLQSIPVATIVDIEILPSPLKSQNEYDGSTALAAEALLESGAASAAALSNIFDALLALGALTGLDHQLF